MKAFLIFPHQLFEENISDVILTGHTFYLVEDPLYFIQYAFHQHKLVLHRASMKHYFHKLQSSGLLVHYLEFTEVKDMNQLLNRLTTDGTNEVYYRELHDDWLTQRLLKAARKSSIRIIELDSPMFLSTKQYLIDYFAGKDKFFMADFYMDQRKKYDILMDGEKPQGGKWSFDEDNRKKLPKHMPLPKPYFPPQNDFVKEAIVYVEKHFDRNPGKARDFKFAATHHEAALCLQDFISNRFHNFGTYEDAISYRNPFLFHSILTPYLNTGLLTPAQVVDAINGADVPHNSKEGYIRQIIGWREYMRACYELKGITDRTSNFWNHKRSIPKCFRSGNTGIAPVDSTIQKVIKHAYTHHIERLMIVGNFFLLCEFAPDEVYQWFMEMYIDAYDWVMVPNVYSMSQYSSGGTTTTKPYISSSNYIIKMSDFGKGDWSEIWDGLYWRFIQKHRSFFADNPRLAVMTKHLDNMDNEKLSHHLNVAEKYLSSLDEMPL